MRKDRCSDHFDWAHLIECGDTFHKIAVNNWPVEEASYVALRELATQLLDPIVKTFGGLDITYGFCSFKLSKYITKNVAPKLDQHSAMEKNTRGNLICARRGAAVDFFVPGKTSLEVGKFIVANLPFDRLYYYGSDKPLHLSYGPEHSRAIVQMNLSKVTKKRIPKKLRNEDFLAFNGR